MMAVKAWQKHKKAAKNRWKEAAAAERKGLTEMPYPIKNGIARFTGMEEAVWERDDEDDVDIIKLTGVIETPSEHEGKTVTVSHFLMDGQYGTIEDAFDNVLADLKSVGVDVADFDDVDEHIEQAVKEGRRFKFSTSKGKKDRINCYFNGPADSSDAKADDQEEKPKKKKSWDEKDPFE